MKIKEYLNYLKPNEDHTKYIYYHQRYYSNRDGLRISKTQQRMGIYNISHYRPFYDWNIYGTVTWFMLRQYRNDCSKIEERLCRIIYIENEERVFTKSKNPFRTYIKSIKNFQPYFYKEIKINKENYYAIMIINTISKSVFLLDIIKEDDVNIIDKLFYIHQFWKERGILMLDGYNLSLEKKFENYKVGVNKNDTIHNNI